MSQIPPRNRAERRAAARAKGRRAAGAALTAGSAALAMSAGVLGASAPSAGAATTLTVTDPGNAGAGTLRDALANASDGDTIVFAPGVTSITITAKLLIDDSVTIDGASAVTIHGPAAEGIFYLNVPGTGDVTISGLTLTGGHATAGGGAVHNGNNDHLTVASSIITGNTSLGEGGGLYSGGSKNTANTLTVTSSQITGNTARGGGGIYTGHSAFVTITDSSVSGNTTTHRGGGGLYSYDVQGATTITNSHFDNNDGSGSLRSGGGGLYFDEPVGPVNISGTTITGNTTDNSGGGLYFDEPHGAVSISNSVISGNTAGGNGGGLYLDFFYSGFNIDHTTIAGNTAEAGGGIFSQEGGYGSLTVLDSTISGNSATDGWGGGLYDAGTDSPTKIQNSTISGNTASGEGGAAWFGGYYGLELTQATITGNTATTVGGIALYGPTPVPKAASRHGHAEALKDDDGKHKAAGQAKAHARSGVHAQDLGEVTATGTILSGNVGEDIGTVNGPVGAVLTSDHSLVGVVGDGITLTDTGGTINSTNPMLGPLQNNGGPTETHALLPGSPAINTGPNPVPVFPTNEFDQRGDGFARVVDGVVDIGAYEVQPPPPTPEPLVIAPKFTG